MLKSRGGEKAKNGSGRAKNTSDQIIIQVVNNPAVLPISKPIYLEVKPKVSAHSYGKSGMSKLNQEVRLW